MRDDPCMSHADPARDSTRLPGFALGKDGGTGRDGQSIFAQYALCHGRQESAVHAAGKRDYHAAQLFEPFAKPVRFAGNTRGTVFYIQG